MILDVDRLIGIVRSVWSSALKGQRFDDHDTFAECGGDSLSLLVFHLSIERRLGIKIPVAAFTVDMSLQDCLSVIRQREWIARANESDAREAMFLLAPYPGELSALAKLRAACGPELSIVTIPLPSWEEMVTPGFDYDSLADIVLEYIDAHSGTGPVRIAGYSRGGFLAAVVARRLLDLDRPVQCLALLDVDVERLQVGIDAGESARLSKTSGGRRPTVLLRCALQTALVLAGRGRLMRSLGFLVRAVLPSAMALEFDFELSCAQADVLLARWSRSGRWRSLSLPMRTVLFRAEMRKPGRSPDLGWSRYCPDLAVENTPGTHITMLEAPHLQQLRNRLIHHALIASRPFLIDLS